MFGDWVIFFFYVDYILQNFSVVVNPNLDFNQFFSFEKPFNKKCKFRQVVSTWFAWIGSFPSLILERILGPLILFIVKCSIDKGGKEMEEKIKELMREIIVTLGAELLSI